MVFKVGHTPVLLISLRLETKLSTHVLKVSVVSKMGCSSRRACQLERLKSAEHSAAKVTEQRWGTKLCSIFVTVDAAHRAAAARSFIA